MRKALTIITLFTCMLTFAQREVAKKIAALNTQNVTFKPFNVLSAVQSNADAGINRVIEGATFATINHEALAAVVANKSEYIQIAIPYQNSTIKVQMYKVNIFAEGFHADTDKARAIPYEPGVYYRGIVEGDGESVAAFSFFNNELIGLISAKSFNNLVVGRLDRANNTNDYIIYSDAKMKVQNDFECHTDDATATQETGNRNPSTVESTRCVTMYFEMDYSLFTTAGSNTTTATNWMTAVFNNVKTLYNNDGVSVALKSIFIWTTPDAYTGETSSDYLAQFNEVRPIFDGDVGQLVAIDSGGLGGVAKTINGLCGVNNYSYSDLSYSYNSVPTYSWTIMVVTHEFGHLLGSPHTHACIWNGNNTPIDSCGPYSIGSTGEGYSCMATPALLPSSSAKGTIMSYCHLVGGIGINLANGFGPQPLARVLTAVNSGTCLSTDCINTCINTVVSINAVTDGTSATISWTQLSNTTNWLVSVTPFNTAPVWVAVTGSTYAISGLVPNTFYKVIVRPNCDAAMTTEERQYVFVTETSAYCDGIVITDSGGPTANYSMNENYVRTFIPNIADKKIRLTFSSFFLIGQDYLYIHNGNSTAAPDMTNGGLTGNTIPAAFESTASDGSLTIHFVSDNIVTRPGFVAQISCESVLASNTFVQPIDFTYSPNPTNNFVSIASKTAITNLMVYNNLGQLLFQQKAMGKETSVDLSACAAGTYFFKLKFEDQESNFKILKK